MKRTYRELRKSYPEFHFKSYEIEEEPESLTIRYNYSVPNLTNFSSRFVFPISKTSQVDLAHLEPLIFSLGIVEMISYWKAVCSPNIHIEAGKLSQSEIPFWKELFYQGLGEFRYLNNIKTTKDDFTNFVFNEREKKTATLSLENQSKELHGNLIPIGGGKDSVVTLETLKGHQEENLLYLFNPRPACYRTAEVAGYSSSKVITVKRFLDKELLNLNDQGFLNGHTPFSALLAFSSLITASLYGKKYIVLSNEESASESNIVGSDINHQYSKSYKFEKDFREYVENELQTPIQYFSLLRSVNEVQIGGLFSLHKKYHQIFRSCNKGCYTDTWCGKCSKCLFTALILSPYLSENEIAKIINSDILNDIELSEILSALYREDKTKPFECVGTKEESLSILHYLLSKKNNNPLIQTASDDIKTPDSEKLNTLLKAWNDTHFIPEEYAAALSKSLEDIQI